MAKDSFKVCHAAKDGECIWKYCPQLKDNEPHKTGRDCPLEWVNR